MFQISSFPKYYQTDSELEQFRYRLKQEACPHCRRTGCLILHGYLYGYSEGTGSDQVIRGRRFFCCNKYRQKGCGGTFSILHSEFIHRFIIRANSLWTFLRAILEGFNIKEALAIARPNYSVSSGYRLWKRFIHSQPRIRTAILSLFPAHKSVSCLSSLPEIQTIQDLSCSFSTEICPVQVFQYRMQMSFF